MFFWILFFTWPIFAFIILIIFVLCFLDTDVGTYLFSKHDKQYYRGKVIWITGASSGIGKALSIAFVKQGAKVILSSRRKETLDQLRDDILKPLHPVDPSHIAVVPMDVSDFEQVKKCGEEAWNTFGHVDVLVNNAGVSMRTLAVQTDFDSVDMRLINIDLVGQIAVTKTILKRMTDRNSGQLINISSAAGKLGAPFRSAYCAAKWGLLGYFESIRTECTLFNIKVCNVTSHFIVYTPRTCVFEPTRTCGTLVCPGFIQTKVAHNALTGDGSSTQKADPDIDNGIPVDRCADLIVNAASGNLAEVWIARGKAMAVMYLFQYFPFIGRTIGYLAYKGKIQKAMEK